MQVRTSLQTDSHASTPPLSFLQAGCPSCRPTNSVKALKAKIANRWQTDGGVVDVVVGCNHAQIQRRHIHFIFNADALLKHSKNYTHSPTWCHFTNQQCCEYKPIKGKGSPYSIAERRVPELMPVLGIRPAGDVSHKPCGWVNRGTMGVNSLPKTVTQQRHICNLNPGPTAPESNTLTTRLPSQYPQYIPVLQDFTVQKCLINRFQSTLFPHLHQLFIHEAYSV